MSCTFSASKNSFSFSASSNLVKTSATEWFPKWLSSAGRRRVGARRTICIWWKLPAPSVGRWREWWACWNRQALSPLAPPEIAPSLSAPKSGIPSRPAPPRLLTRCCCRISPRWTPLKDWIIFKSLNVWRFDRGQLYFPAWRREGWVRYRWADWEVRDAWDVRFLMHR